MDLVDLARSALAAWVTHDTAHYRWRVILLGGARFEVCCLPETTASEMRELYPGATLEPLPDELGPSGIGKG